MTFFRDADPDVRDYIADRLQVAFYYHLLSIDPVGSELVRDSLADKVLYLDTNFIYRLLGLHGPTYVYRPAAVADISSRLGFTLRVTRETINEYLRSLRAELYRLRAHPVTRRSYVQVLADNPSDDHTFMQAYFKLFMSGRVKGVDEFEQRYTSIVPLLQEWGVDIEERELTDAERNTEEFRDQFSNLNTWHGQQKPVESIDHDVFLAQLIRRSRGIVDDSAAAVRYWLLTYDRKLARYSVYYANADQLPFCMMADDWMQITRPFLPRTEDYQNAFCALLDNPALYPSGPAVPFEHMADAMHRLERYRELPPRVVASMVASAEFVRKLRAVSSSEDEAEVIELAAAEEAGLVSEENETLRTAVSDLTDRFSRLEDRLRASGNRLERVSDERDDAKELAAGLRNQLAQHRKRARLEQAHMEARFEERMNRKDVERKEGFDREVTRLKWGTYLFVSLVVLLQAFGFVSGMWTGLTGARRGVVVGSIVLILVGSLAIPLGNRAWKILLGATTLVGALGLAYQLWMS